jgi:GT2 family glycosyltransferase
VLLMPNFIQALVDAGQFDSKIGTVCGKLLTMSAHFEIPERPVVDSTGIYFNPMLRHLDRGSQEIDNGHYLQYEYVFGATAAAALYRRTMIDDISLDGEFFDSDFFVYREDADVAWRAQLMGWKCMYAPYARGYHVRKVLPGNRRALPPEINMHSVKNRFLMRIKNISADLYARNAFSITARDLAVVMCCLLWEHSSLKAFWFLARNFPRVFAKRRLIQSRRRVDAQYMASWFQYAPVSKQAPKRTPRPAPREAAREAAKSARM